MKECRELMRIHLGITYYLGCDYKLAVYIKGDVSEHDISNIQDVIERRLRLYYEHDEHDSYFEFERYPSYTPNYPYERETTLFSLTALPDKIDTFLAVLSNALITNGYDVGVGK